jgi:hypothetical protein
MHVNAGAEKEINNKSIFFMLTYNSASYSACLKTNKDGNLFHGKKKAQINSFLNMLDVGSKFLSQYIRKFKT